MKQFLTILAVLIGLPLSAAAQGNTLSAEIAPVTGFCLATPTPDCDSAITALLAQIAAAGNDRGLLVALATSLANAADPGLPLPVLATLARALTLVANASPDPLLRGQILQLAAIVSTGDSIALQADNLLASPN